MTTWGWLGAVANPEMGVRAGFFVAEVTDEQVAVIDDVNLARDPLGVSPKSTNVGPEHSVVAAFSEVTLNRMRVPRQSEYHR